jgi:hypothetical protein
VIVRPNRSLLVAGVLAVIWLCFGGLDVSAAALYVAPDGDDANPGTKEKPFATIQRAQNTVRALKKNGLPNDGVTVTLRDGTYFLEETLLFTPEDSGTKGRTITWTAAPGETAILSGGRQIVGWKKGEKNLWTANLPEVKAGKWTFRQLYVNGKRAVRARTPYFRLGNVTGGADGQPLVYHVPKGIVKKWNHVREVEAVSLGRWAILRRPLEASDPVTGQATIAGPYKVPHPALLAQRGVACFFENALEELDEPGEWYLDRESGVLHYRPRAGEDMATAAVMAPMLERLVDIAGTDDTPVRELRFENLHFAHSHWPLPEQGYIGLQAGHHTRGIDWSKPPWKPVDAAVILRAAEDCRFRSCVFSALGGSGLRFSDLCRRNAVTHSRFFDIAANAVMVGRSGHPAKVVKTGRAAKDTRVTDNRISKCGTEFFGAVGIWAGITEGTRIEHNEIYDMPYTGISVGWLWTPKPTDARNNVIAFNHVHHVMQTLADGGGIYTLGFQPGTIVRGNRIHDLRRGPWAEHGGPIYGLYLDQGSKGFLIENNVVHDIPSLLRLNRCDRSWHTWKGNAFVKALTKPAYRDGVKGKALSCGELERGIDIPHAPRLDPPALTVEAWIKINRIPTGEDQRRWVVNKNGNEWFDGHYALIVIGDRPGAYLNIGGGQDNSLGLWGKPGVLTANAWHHLAMSYDGKVLKVYHNGRLQAEKTVDRARKPGDGNLRLGDRADDRNGFLLPGLLDEVRVYNRALSDEEIAQRHRAPLEAPPDDCVGYWGFNNKADLLSPDVEAVLKNAGPRPKLEPSHVVEPSRKE